MALDRVEPVVDTLAVNAHHHAEQIAQHLAEQVAPHLATPVHLSLEEPEALGTAGALGALRGWLDGRGALVVNGDTWCEARFEEFVAGWDGERIRIMVTGDAPFGPRSGVVASLVPWPDIAPLAATPSGLYELCWRAAAEAGRVDTVAYHGPFVDCARPADYLRANMEALLRHTTPTPGLILGENVTMSGSAHAAIIGAGAAIGGTVHRSVVWPGAVVRAGETLVDAIRIDTRTTVLIRC